MRRIGTVLLGMLCVAACGATVLAADAGPREGFVSVPGGRVWYRIVGKGEGIPLLVLHGGPGFPHDYLEPLAKLADERPVVFYDQLGCGKSDRPADHTLWRTERFVEELAAVRKALGLERVHILGHDWGTQLATDYALTQPPGIVSLTLADPVLNVKQWEKDTTAMRAKLPKELVAVLERHEKLGATDCPEYQGAMVPYYRRNVCRMDPWPDALEHTFAGFNTDVFQTMWGPSVFAATGTLKDYDRTGRLKEIHVPALFLCGRFDEATPETTESYHKLLPNSEMTIFDHSTHMPHLEETDRFIQVVRDFLQKADKKLKEASVAPPAGESTPKAGAAAPQQKPAAGKTPAH